MNFNFTEEQIMLRDTVRKFTEKEVNPLVDRAEEEGTFPEGLLDKIGGLGILKIGQPSEYGGYGGRMEECIVTEEIARVNAGIATVMLVQKVVLPMIFKIGTKEQIEKYALPTLEGRKMASLSVTEPNAGSDVKSISTTAKREGQYYVINGSKMFTSMANISDYMVVAAYTNKDIGFKGISLLIVDRDTENVEIRKVKKLVTRTAPTTEVYFDNCRVHESKLLGGKEEGGFYRIMESFNGERILSGARSVGIATGAYEAALKYANERIQFKRPIAEFQVIAYKLADMLVNIEAARHLVYRAAWLYDNKERYIKEASIAKLFATEMAQKVTLEAVQIHGGYGVTEDFPVARFHRDTLIGTIGAGTSEIQRYIISKEIGIRLSF
jgi:alkylation response protein AidB-like acyl-CoA dehydrogenase